MVLFTPLAPGAGNGAPSGGLYYQLQMIWSPKGVCSGTSGRVLHVPRDSNFSISLIPGDDFEVTPNKCQLQFPIDVTTKYQLYVRPVGKPGSGAKIQSCALDLNGDEVCSISKSVQVRTSGSSKFTNESSKLLYVTGYDVNGDPVSVELFDSSLTDYIWKTETQGKVHLQLRFYEN